MWGRAPDGGAKCEGGNRCSVSKSNLALGSQTTGHSGVVESTPSRDAIRCYRVRENKSLDEKSLRGNREITVVFLHIPGRVADGAEGQQQA